MPTLRDPEEIQRYIQRLEAQVQTEQAGRQQAEAQLAAKATYISFLESFLFQLGRKLGVSGNSKETLDGMLRKVDELLAKR